MIQSKNIVYFREFIISSLFIFISESITVTKCISKYAGTAKKSLKYELLYSPIEN